MRKTILLLLAFLCLASVAWTGHPEYWMREELTLKEWGKQSLLFNNEQRFSQPGFTPFHIQLGPRWRYKYSDSTTLGLGYQLIERRVAGPGSFRPNHRFEAEMTNKFKVDKTTTLELRSRYQLVYEHELRRFANTWREKLAHIVATKEPFPFGEMRWELELFYSLDHHVLEEVRFHPLYCTWKLEDNRSFSPYLLVRWRHRDWHWHPTLALGFTLKL